MSEQDYTGAYGEVKQSSDLALYSLIAGVLAYVFFPIIGAIASIILGHMSLGEIRRSGGVMKGRGMAVAGLLLGYLQVLGSVLLGILLVLGLGFALFVASESDVEVDGDKVTVSGPMGAKLEVDDVNEKVHLVAPGAEVKVDGETVIVKSSGGEVERRPFPPGDLLPSLGHCLPGTLAKTPVG